MGNLTEKSIEQKPDESVYYPESELVQVKSIVQPTEVEIVDPPKIKQSLCLRCHIPAVNPNPDKHQTHFDEGSAVDSLFVNEVTREAVRGSIKVSTVSKSLSPLRTGNYYAPGVWYNQRLVVEGPKAFIKDSFGDSHNVKIDIGNFGKVGPEINSATSQDFYNMKLTRPESIEYGVVSQDGAEITMNGATDIFAINWISQEEADALDADGDPVEAPSCPYKIQPENPGKFLWITGPTCTGKSTSAQQLSKNAGYVYYEGDCFWVSKNPYVPVDAPEPSIVAYQRNLIGEGLEARRKSFVKVLECYARVFRGEDYDMEDYKEFYGMLCENIKKERKRIGGDWVVAKTASKRETRDFIRSCLGPELVFVVLIMEEEERKKRILRRSIGDARVTEEILERMLAAPKHFDPLEEDEENGVQIMVTDQMTEEDVANKILQMVS